MSSKIFAKYKLKILRENICKTCYPRCNVICDAQISNFDGHPCWPLLEIPHLGMNCWTAPVTERNSFTNRWRGWGGKSQQKQISSNPASCSETHSPFFAWTNFCNRAKRRKQTGAGGGGSRVLHRKEEFLFRSDPDIHRNLSHPSSKKENASLQGELVR